jgi:glutathione peroxidase
MVAGMKTILLLLATIMTATLSLSAAESLYNIPLKDIDGQDTSLKAYRGKVLLLVNVAFHSGPTSNSESPANPGRACQCSVCVR